ncbi:MAG: restriction endonuclease subunit S [Peptoanaerobacter stomatis]|uniref:restriction endonuclease subunit S n=1 Tax=Peptoanaerobacter stomatis TaxID=796937 RepID=UPI003F9EDD7A
MLKTVDECFFYIQNGANIKQGDIDGGFPITRIETIANDKFNRDRMGFAGIINPIKYEQYILEDGDLLMSHINSVQYLGRTVLYEKMEDEVIIHGMNLLRLRANRNIINPAYAKYYFYGYKFKKQLNNITKKSVNQASFSVKDLKKIIIDIPTISEQDKLVKILDKAHKIIRIRQNELLEMNNLIKARFVEMFGLPISNLKCFKTEKMEDVAPIVNYSGKFEDEVWLLNLDMIEAQTGRILNYLMVSENEVGNSTCTFDTSNVLYSKLRPYLNKVVIPNRCGYATSELVPLQPVVAKINREYFAFMLRSDEFVNMINGKVAGAKMPRVSMENFRKFDVPVPPMPLQEKFAIFVKQVDKSKLI